LYGHLGAIIRSASNHSDRCRVAGA
jgi:hypothetical protein